MYKQVARLLKRASHISVDALTTLQDSSPWYYNLVGYAVSQPWHTVRRHNTINPNLVTRFRMGQLSNDILQRYESCLARLLGSPLYGGKPCDVTSECWNLMIRPGEVGYMLTHQALYFMLGEQRGESILLIHRLQVVKSLTLKGSTRENLIFFNLKAGAH